MANALAAAGLAVTYIGCLGYPALHPVFADLAKRAKVISIAEPGHTDALEFEDGKLMLGKHQSLGDVNWDNLQSRVGQGSAEGTGRRGDADRHGELDDAAPSCRTSGRKLQSEVIAAMPKAASGRCSSIWRIRRSGLREDISGGTEDSGRLPIDVRR